jgi:chaperonin GroEL
VLATLLGLKSPGCVGSRDGSVIVGKILENDQYAYGFDAQKGEYVNLVGKGIIDPTKVVRSACKTLRQLPGC